MRERSDIHRPGAIVPSNYDYVMSYHTTITTESWPIPPFQVQEALAIYNKDGARIHPSLFQCDVCGAHYKEGELWRHRPTGQVISVGHICAANYELFANDSDYVNRRAAHIRASIAAAERAQRAERAAAFAAGHPGLTEALARPHRILSDLAAKLAQWGSLSDKQVALALKIARELDAPTTPKVDAVEGRQVIQGRVASVKEQEGAYGLTLKMLVVVATPAGEWRTWGTVPSSLLGKRLRGAIVKFTATVEASRDDKAFSFFRRPTNAELLEAAPA